jgi:hypothetical protein
VFSGTVIVVLAATGGIAPAYVIFGSALIVWATFGPLIE